MQSLPEFSAIDQSLKIPDPDDINGHHIPNQLFNKLKQEKGKELIEDLQR
jgi:hypothetical protein